MSYSSVYTNPEEIYQEAASKDQGMVPALPPAVISVTEPEQGTRSVSINYDSTPYEAVPDSCYVHHPNNSRLYEFNNFCRYNDAMKTF